MAAVHLMQAVPMILILILGGLMTLSANNKGCIPQCSKLSGQHPVHIVAWSKSSQSRSAPDFRIFIGQLLRAISQVPLCTQLTRPVHQYRWKREVPGYSTRRDTECGMAMLGLPTSSTPKLLCRVTDLVGFSKKQGKSTRGSDHWTVPHFVLMRISNGSGTSPAWLSEIFEWSFLAIYVC